MRTLIYDVPDSKIMDEILSSPEIEVVYTIHPHANFKKDLDSSELTKKNFPPHINFEVSEKSQKIYLEFYDKYFNTFSYQFMRRGLKTLDIHEIRNYFSYFFHSFFKVIEKNNVELAIFFFLPHEGPDFIMYQITRLLGIKTILMHQSIFPNKYFTVKKCEDLGDFQISKNTEFKLNMNDIEKYKNIYSEAVRETKKKQKKNKKANTRFLKNLILRSLIKLKIIHREDQNYLQKKYEKNLSRVEKKYDEIKNFQKDKKIIFFPLHAQPELSTSLLGEKYEDQILVLERLNSFAKDKWIVIAKENIYQTSYQRDDFFFKRLKGLKNVFFVDKSESTQLIMNDSDLVATICGTIGYEALTKSKKCLVFGNAWYKNFHGVLKINNDISDSTIESFLKNNFDQNKFLGDLKNLLLFCDNGVATHDEVFKEMVQNFDSNQNSKSILKNITKFIDLNYK
tara:strand:- start:1534 stop:2892 length:1359 start_codon:yes stop_codon:yes gene_type:complete